MSKEWPVIPRGVCTICGQDDHTAADPITGADRLRAACYEPGDGMKAPKTYIGLPVAKKEADAYLLYDVTANEIMGYAPGVFWSLAKSKAMRENGTGHKVVYLGFPWAG